MNKSKVCFSPIWSVVIALAVTAVALGIGYLLWQSVSAPSVAVERGGITASVPAGWLVQKGIEGEERVFSASNPLQPHLAYQVLQLPLGEGMAVSDAVSNRNLNRASKLSTYRVLDQVDVAVGGRKALKVHFAYVDASDATGLPVIIEGADYYFENGSNVVVISMEDTSDKYSASLPVFQAFIDTVKFSGGGAK